MKKLKVLCASAALVLVAGALVGCQDRGNSSSGSGTTKEAGITVWAPLAHQDVYIGFLPGFKEKYIEFWSSGGRDYPLEVLKIIDIDLCDAKFFESAMNDFKDTLNQFRKIYYEE